MVVIPAAIAGAILVNIAVVVVYSLGLSHYMSLDSLLAQIYLKWFGSLIFGATLVYIASYVAPVFKLHVAVVMATLVLILSGVLLFVMISRGSWPIFEIFCLNAGSIGMAYDSFRKRYMAMKRASGKG